MLTHRSLARLFALVGALFATAFVTGCNGDNGEDDGGGCRDYQSIVPGGSFSGDVLPLVSRACALSNACHQGDAGEGTESLGLGPPMSETPTQSTINGVHDGLLNQAPLRSTNPFITPGDPTMSWLLTKMDYTTDQIEICGDCDDCGVLMPQGSIEPLPENERDIVAAWILAGAQNN